MAIPIEKKMDVRDRIALMVENSVSTGNWNNLSMFFANNTMPSIRAAWSVVLRAVAREKTVVLDLFSASLKNESIEKYDLEMAFMVQIVELAISSDQGKDVYIGLLKVLADSRLLRTDASLNICDRLITDVLNNREQIERNAGTISIIISTLRGTFSSPIYSVEFREAFLSGETRE